MISLTRDLLTDFDAVTRREWLVTNGIGGFASGTLAGMNSRRYHGLLIASLRPPVERVAMVAKLDAVAVHRGQRIELATNEFADGTVAPRGYVHLDSFALDGQIPVWTWLLGDALLEQRIWMAHGANTTYVSFALTRGDVPIELEFSPLCTYRDYHAHHRGFRDIYLEALGKWRTRALLLRCTSLSTLERRRHVQHRAASGTGTSSIVPRANAVSTMSRTCSAPPSSGSACCRVR